MRSESSEGLQRLEYVRTHTQSLSGRSLGGLDRAAALPGQRRRGRSGGSVQEELEEVLSQASRGVEFCVVIVAALIQKYARLLTTTYSSGAASRPLCELTISVRFSLGC